MKTGRLACGSGMADFVIASEERRILGATSADASAAEEEEAEEVEEEDGVNFPLNFLGLFKRT